MPNVFRCMLEKTKFNCPPLSIHGKEMLKTEKEKYLGNILSSNAKINENIKSRCIKGVGLINETINTLNAVRLLLF